MVVKDFKVGQMAYAINTNKPAHDLIIVPTDVIEVGRKYVTTIQHRYAKDGRSTKRIPDGLVSGRDALFCTKCAAEEYIEKRELETWFWNRIKLASGFTLKQLRQIEEILEEVKEVDRE